MKNHQFDAVIFDLDGVITKTALVHSYAWKRMFNDYLKYREEKYGEPFREFTHEGDYLPHVDGKPRYKGVADFLKSRDIDIPYGDPSDDPDKETVCGLGNRKNSYFVDILEKDGVEVYDSTINLLDELKEAGIHIGVASSSKNCKKVLEASDLLHYFETRVDGVVSAELGLNGKPEPDIFTTACDNLGVAYDRTVVIEDAVSGVQAGRKGGFGLTLGVAREDNLLELRKNGADIVVEDIAEFGGLERINHWFENEARQLRWSLNYLDYESGKEKSREALLTTGNGFFATRGAFEEVEAGKTNYPGSYMTGLYNRRKSKVGDRWIENEDFVNFINWLPVNFRTENSGWFDPNNDEFEIEERRLDLKTGLLKRSVVVKHPDGKKTRVVSRRCVSMADPNLACLSYAVEPLNYSGKIYLKSSIDGDLINDGVARYRDLDQHHLDQLEQGRMNGLGYVIVKTNQSGITISASEKLKVTKGDQEIPESNFSSDKGKITTVFEADTGENEEIELYKLVCIQNSRDFNVNNPLGAALDKLDDKSNFDTIFEASKKEWEKIWKEADIEVEGDRFTQMLLRLHIYHLVVTASPHHKHLDAGIPARGLHGEAYRGHIFWDELYIFPFYASHFPETARSVLMYRYRRMDKAKKYAKESGFEGAMFPWQSGSDGREETQVVHLNPVSGEWGPDYSSLQRHISAAIAYNIWQYYQITGDQDFMNQYGAEMFFEISRFWASKALIKGEDHRYSIDKVMGPDEFHEKLPDAKEGGLTDNAYTNIMAIWCIEHAFEIMDHLEMSERKRVVDKIGLEKEELVKWKDMTRSIKLNFNEDGILEQFDGYFGLKELDWESYRKRYSDIHRMDRILKAEGRSPDDYKVAKQTDTLMTHYNIDEEEVKSLIKNLGYEIPDNFLRRNLDYYIERTSHGSTLSRVVYAYLAEISGEGEKSWELYHDSLASDYIDIQGGTTGEGIHAGVMGGTVLSALTLFCRFNWRGVALRIDPDLPNSWKKMRFHFTFRKDKYDFEVSNERIKIYFKSHDGENGRIFVRGMKYELNNDSEKVIELK